LTLETEQKSLVVQVATIEQLSLVAASLPIRHESLLKTWVYGQHDLVLLLLLMSLGDKLKAERIYELLVLPTEEGPL